MHTVLNTPMKTVNKCTKIVLHVLVYFLAKYCGTCIPMNQNYVQCSVDKASLNLVLKSIIISGLYASILYTQSASYTTSVAGLDA